MPLLGSAAMLLSFDVAAEAIAERDQWHTQEHLPERLSIPDFVRGTRRVVLQGQPRYFVMYEVERLATLNSAAYLERLNHPSPWTAAKIMPHYPRMARGFCSVTRSFGSGIGHSGLLLRFMPVTGTESSLRAWLLQDLARLPSTPGIGSAHLFEGALTPQITNEQRIRGADAGFDWALFVTGYSQDALAQLMQADLGSAELERHGATGVLAALYRMDYALTGREVGA